MVVWLRGKTFILERHSAAFRGKMWRCVSPIFKWFGKREVCVHVLQGDRAALTVPTSSNASEGYMVVCFTLSILVLNILKFKIQLNK